MIASDAPVGEGPLQVQARSLMSEPVKAPGHAMSSTTVVFADTNIVV